MTREQLEAQVEQAIADRDTDAMLTTIRALGQHYIDKIEAKFPEAVGLFDSEAMGAAVVRYRELNRQRTVPHCDLCDERHEYPHDCPFSIFNT